MLLAYLVGCDGFDCIVVQSSKDAAKIATVGGKPKGERISCGPTHVFIVGITYYFFKLAGRNIVLRQVLLDLRRPNEEIIGHLRFQLYHHYDSRGFRTSSINQPGTPMSQTWIVPVKGLAEDCRKPVFIAANVHV
jgi:hypothetical protein